jgi:hypothetical protein
MDLLTAFIVFFIVYGFFILLLALISRKLFESFVVASKCMVITILAVLFFHYVGKDYIPNEPSDLYRVSNVTRTIPQDKDQVPTETPINPK